MNWRHPWPEYAATFPAARRPEKHGSAMAMWGVGVMVGPHTGAHPRWLPHRILQLALGILYQPALWHSGLAGPALFLDESPVDRKRHFDLLGFAFLGLTIAALQMALDRGELLGWLNSPEIMLELSLAALCSYLLVFLSCTAAHAFISPGIFRDRSSSAGLIMFFAVGIILLATMALLPPFLQHLTGYPVVTTGLLLAPRGIGTMLAMLIAGRLRGTDNRYKIALGLVLISYSLREMTFFTPNISQGLGLGFVFVPLSTPAFATLAPAFRNEGTALFSRMRNIGSSIGIAWMVTLLAHNTQTNHAAFASYITNFSLPLQQAIDTGNWSLETPTGLSALNATVTREAQILAYLQDFQTMIWVTPAALLLSLMKAPLLQPTRPQRGLASTTQANQAPSKVRRRSRSCGVSTPGGGNSAATAT
nr:MFS transporter [Marinobacterium rhizophilum]